MPPHDRLPAIEVSNSSPSESDDTALTPAVADEELFAAYLAARVQQGLEALEAARVELARQLDDFNRALRVMRKVQELRELRQELDAQQARVNAARSAAGLAPGPADQTPQAVAQATPGPAFRTAQAERAAKIMAALAAKPLTCPSCQALLAAGARCRCGHIDATEADAPIHGGANPPDPSNPLSS